MKESVKPGLRTITYRLKKTKFHPKYTTHAVCHHCCTEDKPKNENYNSTSRGGKREARGDEVSFIFSSRWGWRGWESRVEGGSLKEARTEKRNTQRAYLRERLKGNLDGRKKVPLK